MSMTDQDMRARYDEQRAEIERKDKLLADLSATTDRQEQRLMRLRQTNENLIREIGRLKAQLASSSAMTQTYTFEEFSEIKSLKRIIEQLQAQLATAKLGEGK